ncbi:MAG: hypothetical protein ACKVH8_13710 [Pirellulales bacterium]
MHKWNARTEIPAKQFVEWIDIGSSKYLNWKQRYGKANEHNGLVPRDHWLEPLEKEAIVAYHTEHPLIGYRCLTYMMLDANIDIVGVVGSSPIRPIL